mmetsp:Transcript_4738/g.12155  ORF Transcript_4738/g.12155 Transcript_4738/m.12155 type:complete len:106 (+) Transcript_4738:1010-1327(+)
MRWTRISISPRTDGTSSPKRSRCLPRRRMTAVVSFERLPWSIFPRLNAAECRRMCLLPNVQIGASYKKGRSRLVDREKDFWLPNNVVVLVDNTDVLFVRKERQVL